MPEPVGSCDYGYHHRSIPKYHTRRTGCVNWTVRPTLRERKTRQTRAILDVLMSSKIQQHYGYSIMASTGLTSSTVYPILNRMEADGWVVATWHRAPKGPPRKVYKMTDYGMRAATAWINS